MLNTIIRYFKKLKSKSQTSSTDIFIPTIIGLRLIEGVIPPEQVLCYLFGAQSFEELTEKEAQEARFVLEEVKKTVQNPKIPEDLCAHDLTPSSVVKFEDVNTSIMSAPYFLGYIYKKTDQGAHEYAERALYETDFRDFYPRYFFFSTYSKIRLKTGRFFTKDVKRFFAKTQKKINYLPQLWRIALILRIALL